MNIVSEVKSWQALRKSIQPATVGFVPTMGHLHAGHVSLCERARVENAVVVVSIFVNPTQFNQTQDFALYPRTLESDLVMLEQAGVDYVYLPKEEDLYQDQYQVQVSETTLSQELEGEFRPGHFTGMLTVVLKLLNQMQATRAYFGEKDYQQLLLVQKMVEALFIPTDIVPCQTKRAVDGLALSSRNSRLSTAGRELAAHFPRLLGSQADLSGIQSALQALGFKVDYIAEQWGRRLGAVWIDEVRLIDNIPLDNLAR